MSEADGGGLPLGWTTTRLGSILEVVRGVTYRKEDSRTTPAEGFLPVLRANNIQEHLLFADLVYVPTSDVSAEQMLRLGDVVVAASSGSRAVVGKAAQMKQPWHGAFGAFCFGLRPETGIEQRFLGWFLHTKEYRNRVSALSAGTSINNLRAEHVEDTPLRVPPRDEQARIADALDELFSDLDAAVASLERVRAKLKLHRASVLKAAVEGALTAEWRAQHPTVKPASELLDRILAERRRLWEEAQLAKFKAKGQEPPKNWKAKYKAPVGSDGANLPALPEGWVWATLEQLSTKVVDGVHKKPTYVSAGIPFVTVRNLTAGPGISFDRLRYVTLADHNDFTQRADPKRGDILVSKDGTLGVVRLVDTDVAFSIFVSVALIQPVMPEMQHFLGAALSSPQVQAQMVPKGSGLVHIHLEDLRRDCIPVVPLAEQEAIVEIVEDQMSVIDHLEADIDAKLKSAQALRQAILRHAFSGKLVPQDPNDEPASELLKRIAAEREARARETDSIKARKPRRAVPRKKV